MNTLYNKFKLLIGFFTQDIDYNLVVMRIAMYSIGFSICYFASDGYTTLFSSGKFSILGWETSFVGLFMILLEFGVLAYITHMFSHWYRKSVMQKVYLGFVILCFSLLCYSGMSSYLWKAYSSEYQSVRSSTVQVDAINTRINNNQKQVADLEVRLVEQSERVTEVEAKVQDLNAQIAQNSKDKSERRTRYANCSTSIDCSGAIADLERAGSLLESNLNGMLQEKTRAQEKYAKLESRKESLLDAIAAQHQEKELLTLETGGMDAERREKISSINSIVISVYDALGKPKPDEPFKVAVNFISIIIYPCYILLNLCLGFNSRGNRLASRLKVKKSTVPLIARLSRARPEKIIIPVPANVTADELDAYVSRQSLGAQGGNVTRFANPNSMDNERDVSTPVEGSLNHA